MMGMMGWVGESGAVYRKSYTELVIVWDSFATAHAVDTCERMCPHEQRCRPPPPGGESEGGKKCYLLIHNIRDLEHLERKKGGWGSRQVSGRTEDGCRLRQDETR
jgi:hypothetical protein